MRKSDKKKVIAKANLIAEQRYLESKGLINENVFHADGMTEDQPTEFKNSTDVDDQIKSKGDEILNSNPITVYGNWDLENDGEEAAQERLKNPNKFISVYLVKTINKWDVNKLKQGEFGPTIYFNASNGGRAKRIEVTLKGVDSNLISKGHEQITKDGLHSIISIMKMAIDESNDFTTEEKQILLQHIVSHFSNEIAEPYGNDMNEGGLTESAGGDLDLTNPGSWHMLASSVFDSYIAPFNPNKTKDKAITNDNKVLFLYRLLNDEQLGQSEGYVSFEYGRSGREIWTNDNNFMAKYLSRNGKDPETYTFINSKGERSEGRDKPQGPPPPPPQAPPALPQ